MFPLIQIYKMMQEICAESNKKAKAFFCSSCDIQKEHWKNIMPKELYAFIRILIAVGQNHGKRLNLEKMWTSNELFAQSFFTAVMSRNTYTTAFWFTRLDNTAVKDKLEAICSILNQFSEACNENYSPGCNLTADERSATSRGRSSYTLYIRKAIQESMVYWDSMFWSRKYTLAWLMVKGSHWQKIGGHGRNGTIFWVLKECCCWHFQVSSNDWRTVQKWHKNKTQCVPANERSHRHSFSTPKGKSIQAFFGSLITWLLFPMCKIKCNLAFHRYYGNDKANSRTEL